VRLAYPLVGWYYGVDRHKKNLTRVHVETACYIGLSLHCVLFAVFRTFSVPLEDKVKINSGEVLFCSVLFCETETRLCRGAASAVIIIIIELN